MNETTLSIAHRRVLDIIARLHIPHSKEHREFPPYQLDIYLPEWHLCIEVDGPYHTPKADQKRDAALLEQGIPTLRIPHRDVGTAERREAVKECIIDFIEQHAESTAERKAQWKSAKR